MTNTLASKFIRRIAVALAAAGVVLGAAAATGLLSANDDIVLDARKSGEGQKAYL